MYKKIISILLTLVLLLPIAANTYAETTAHSKAALEQRLQEIDEELSQLEDNKENNIANKAQLNKEISLLEEQYETNKEIIEKEKNEISSLELQVSKLMSDADIINGEIKEKEVYINELTEKFQITYDQYCERIRAIYISGGNINKYLMLLETSSVENYLVRLQLISEVSKRDAAIMKQFQDESNEIFNEKELLEKKKKSLAESLSEIKKKQADLKTSRSDLLNDQNDLEIQEIALTKKRNNIDEQIKDIDEKTKEYGELREITASELAEIDNDIANADKRFPGASNSDTTTQTESTTSHSTTQNKNDNSNTTSCSPPETTTTTKPPTYNYLSLTYPVPSYKTITCGYGDYSGHTGCDFSTFGNENQRVVAADSGTVIVSKDLTNADGSYRSYGRYIVIRHDKLTSSGEIAYTLYAHNNSRVVYEGQYVKKGQTIAYSGSTGNSTGPHCHFELRIGGSSQSYSVNPAYYLK